MNVNGKHMTCGKEICRGHREGASSMLLLDNTPYTTQASRLFALRLLIIYHI